MERERPDTAAGPRAREWLVPPDGEAAGRSPTPEHWAGIRLAIDRALDERRILDLRRRQRAAVRRHLVAVRALRPVAVAAIGFAALLPFAAHAWGAGRGSGGAPAAFTALMASTASGPGAAGLASAALCAGALARRAARAGSVEGMVEPVVYAFLGGMAGLAIARGAPGL